MIFVMEKLCFIHIISFDGTSCLIGFVICTDYVRSFHSADYILERNGFVNGMAIN